MTELEAIQLLVKMKELGITQEEIESFKKKNTPPPITIKESDMFQAFNLDDMSEDEILYYATPYYDELQERKKLQLQKKDELDV